MDKVNKPCHFLNVAKTSFRKKIRQLRQNSKVLYQLLFFLAKRLNYSI